MVSSKLTTRSRTTVPETVRDALGIRPGDEIVYLVRGNRVLMTKVGTDPIEDPFALFDDWADEIYTEAYADL